MDRTLVFARRKFAHSLAITAAAVVGGAFGLSDVALSQMIDVSLNLDYADNSNVDSGGTWQLAVKTSDFGLAGITIQLQNISNPLGSMSHVPNGTVNGADYAGLFSEIAAFGAHTSFVAGHGVLAESGEQTRFYGIGSIDDPDGASPNFPGKDPNTTSIGPELTTLSDLQNIPWGTGDFLDDPDWEHAAILFSGTFAPGQAPSFYSEGGFVTEGSLFTSVPAAATGVGAVSGFIEATTVVRTDFGVFTAGDYNRDGVVNIADYTLWRDSKGAMVSPPGSGADGMVDGVIDDLDYNVWKMNFGATTASLTAGALSASPVPEPQGVAIAVFATVAVGLVARGFAARCSRDFAA